MLSYAELEKRIEDVRATVAGAAVAAGRDPESVTIVAVSKTCARGAIDAAYRCGLRHFGENRVQEAQEKFEQPLAAGASLHLVGHLQSKKSKSIPGLFSSVDSIDRMSVIKALDRVFSYQQSTLDVLVQVNIAGESQKSGCSPDEARMLLEAILETGTLLPRGLLTIAPIDARGDALRRVFRDLRELRDHLQTEVHGASLPELSMGMSNDFHDAIAEGATQIRLGRAIFGNR